MNQREAENSGTLAKLYETFLKNEDLPSNNQSLQSQIFNQISHKRSKSSTLTDDENKLVPLLNRLLLLIEDQKDQRSAKQQSKESYQSQAKSQLEIIPERGSAKQKSFIFSKKRYSEDNQNQQSIYLPSFSTSNQSRPETSLTQNNILKPSQSRNNSSLNDNISQPLFSTQNSKLIGGQAKSFAMASIQQFKNNQTRNNQTFDYLKSRNSSPFQLPSLQKSLLPTDSSVVAKGQQANNFFPPQHRFQRQTIDQILKKQSGEQGLNATNKYGGPIQTQNQNINVIDDFRQQRQEIKEILTKTTEKLLDTSLSLQNNIIGAGNYPSKINSIHDSESSTLDKTLKNIKKQELPLLSSYILRVNHPLTVTSKLKRELYNFSDDIQPEVPRAVQKTPSRLVLNKSQIKFKPSVQEPPALKPQLTIEIPHDENPSVPLSLQSNITFQVTNPIQEIEELTLMKVILNLMSRSKKTIQKNESIQEIEEQNNEEQLTSKVNKAIQYEYQDLGNSLVRENMHKEKDGLQRQLLDNHLKQSGRSFESKTKPEIISSSLISSPNSKEDEDLRSLKIRLQPSEENASPPAIKIQPQTNHSINSPTQNNQTPIQQLLQERLQTVMETQESREDQNLRDSTPRLIINQEKGQPEAKMTRKLQQNSQSMQLEESKNFLPPIKPKTNNISLENNNSNNVDSNQAKKKKVSNVIRAVYSMMRKSQSLKNINAKDTSEQFLEVPLNRKQSGLCTDSSFEQSIQSKALKKVEEFGLDRTQTISFGQVTKQLVVSESPINQIQSDLHNFAETIINTEISHPFEYENKDYQRKSTNIQVLPPQESTKEKQLKRTLTPMLGGITEFAAKGQRKFSEYKKNKEEGALSPIALSRQKTKSPLSNEYVKQKTGINFKPPSTPSSALTRQNTTLNRQNSSNAVGSSGIPNTSNNFKRHLTKLKRQLVGI